MQKPDWVDQESYPFQTGSLELEGARLSYLDEGEGPTILMVHGTPTWSYMCRDWIRALCGRYRIIAPDHLGFGLSSASPASAYRPEDHADRLLQLVRRLDLRDLLLVLHDFGGPIGLGALLEEPGRWKGTVLMNTWWWSLEQDRSVRRLSAILGGRFGRLLYTRLNLSAQVLLKAAWKKRDRLTPQVHGQYLAPWDSRERRLAAWSLAGALIGSGSFYTSLAAREQELRDRPSMLLWGLADPAFGPRWDEVRTRLPEAESRGLEGVGHFVPEEAPESLEALEGFAARLFGEGSHP